MDQKTKTLEREKRWAMTAGIAAVAGVAMFFIGQFAGSSDLGSPDGSAEILAAVAEHKSSVMLGAVIQGIGIAMLAIPLAFLFLAALARSDRMRRGFIFVAIVGPLFVGLGTIVSAGTLSSVSGDWKGDATPGVTKCFEDAGDGDSTDSGATGATGATGDAGSAGASTNGSDDAVSLTEDEKQDCRDEAADDLRNKSAGSGLALGLLGSGAIGFLIGLFYTALNAMRVGLLSRFWGSLGMAVGVILILPTLQIIAFAWFIYLGLLLAGWMPGGRPPAWASGEAIPWPVPGAATDDDDVIEGTAEEVDVQDEPGSSAGEIGSGGAENPDEEPQGERRKRKKRS